MRNVILHFLVAVSFASVTLAQATRPVGTVDNPKQVTSADTGPDIDPVKFAKSAYTGFPLFRTFRSFSSACYAVSDVWVYAAGDETIVESEIAYPYPDFYTPTWGEVFDQVARQMCCTWSWNPANRQFKFEKSADKPSFGVQLAEGWESEDRGLYTWHAPKGQQFGMDIYDFGHYSQPADDPEFARKVREHCATRLISNWPEPPKLEAMKAVKIGDHDALQLTVDTPRPGGVWRQWSVMVDGHAFLIVSAMPKTSEAKLLPDIEKMVASFELKNPATRSAK